MKIDVPFYESRNSFDCGPTVLKMVLEYFGIKKKRDDISKEEKQAHSGIVWTWGIASAARKFGLNSKIISINQSQVHDNDFYKKYKDNEASLKLKEAKEDCKKLGVGIIDKDMLLEELLSYVKENESVPIVLLNWYVIRKKEGFTGHFVPVVGYDQENIYVHNPGKLNAQEFMPIKKELFLKAWESSGTDKDVIIIFRD